MIGGLFNVGKAAAPKLAAGGLLGLGATASEDAEAAPMLSFAKGVDAALAARQMKNKLNKDRGKGISGEKSVADYIHRNSNYESGFMDGARKWDGGLNGESYVNGINSMADELIENIDDPYLVEAVEDWRASRLDGSRHSKYGRGAMVAAPAVAAAGTANAGEPSDIGWREWPTQREPTTPAARGFPDWSEYEPEPVVDTSADMMMGNPMGAMGNVAPLSGEEWLNLLGMPMAGLQGIARGLFGLANGEDLVTAGAEASHMMGADSLTPYGHDSGEGWRRYGEHTEDVFNRSGAVTPEIAKGLGMINRIPEYIVPF